MARTAIEALKPGDVLKTDVTAGDGRFLMPRGAQLSQNHIRYLEGFGVTAVDIEDDARDPAEIAARAADPEVRALSGDYCRERFALVDRSLPAAAALFDLCVTRLAWRIAAKGDGFLAKPPIEEQIRQMPAGLRENTGAPGELLSRDVKLVSLPEVFLRINQALQDPASTTGHIADLIGMDPSLSAILLKIVNSAFYSRALRAARHQFPAKVDSLSRAVALVGSSQLGVLALGVSVLSRFDDIPAGLIDMKSFWRHSIFCGILARMLAEKRRASEGEHFFVAGLLHDIGRLIFYRHYPVLSGETLVAARVRKMSLTEAEREIMGFDHAVIGGLLLKKWNYPSSLEKSVRFHHEPGAVLIIDEPAVVHVADCITVALDMGSSGECLVPPLIPEAWDNAGVAPEELSPLALAAMGQCDEIFAAFFPDEA
ncbi:MAG: HDOD domain-containing protein [Desulfovibrionaceae bacterium]|nr:HDOD domain-containing protein [Desulfovibrionaceae bacterium]MBF0512896.1 HDOD domain-containing protein [Desulfovibrionaceae bacterium]